MFQRLTSLSMLMLITMFFGNCFGQVAHDLSDQVAMRMIGHRFLQKLGDSTSRVLPIETLGNSAYKISFESPFEFDPSDMVSTINEVVIETKVTESYAVEVVECNRTDS